MKKIINIIFAGVIFTSAMMPVYAFNNPFSDDLGSYGDAILYLAEKGIVEGYPDGTVLPETEINRAEITKILVEGKGVTPNVNEYNNCFEDVADDWYAPYVCYAKEQGWVQGYANNIFKPEQPIIKAEVLKLILISQDYNIPKEAGFIPYEDVPTSSWYAPYVRVGYEYNLIPDEELNFYPEDKSTRGFSFEILYRTLAIKEFELKLFDKSN
jgi:hypothetical protein